MFQINDSLWKSLELHRMWETLQGFEKNEIPLTENNRKDLRFDTTFFRNLNSAVLFL